MRHLSVLVTTSCLVALAILCPCVPLRAAEDSDDPDVRLLKEAKVGTDDASLLSYLRKRSEDDDALQHQDRLIRQLADSDFEKREQATAKLINLGIVALPKLRVAHSDQDKERARRAIGCVRTIEHESRVNVPLTVVQRLVLRRSAGAIDALLRYLPYTADDVVEEEIYYGLDSLRDGKGSVPAALLTALKDPLPARRAVAACIVGRVGNEEQRGTVRDLLKDANPKVRLRAAQGLLAAKDKAGIPVLITLLNEPDVAVAWPAEELLHWVAGRGSPTVILGAADPEARRRCRIAWEEWWSAHATETDLSQVAKDNRRPGLLLVSGENRAWLCGWDGVPRWELTRKTRVFQVQLLPGNQVLIGDATGINQVNLQGEEIWRADFAKPTGPGCCCCWQLPNGISFFCQGNRIRQFTGDREEFSCELPREWFGLDHGAYPTRNGHLLLSNQDRGQSTLVEVDPTTGEVLGRFFLRDKPDLPRFSLKGILTNDRAILLCSEAGLLLEVDQAGATGWKYQTSAYFFPQEFIRLRNGSTVIASVNRIFEVGPGANTVAERFLDSKLSSITDCLGLVRFGFDPPRPEVCDLDSVAYRLKCMRSEDVRIRRHATSVLSEFRPISADVIDALVQSLGDKDEYVRGWAMSGLASLGEPAVPALTNAIKTNERAIQFRVLETLGGMNKAGASAVPPLVLALQEKDEKVRMYAAVNLDRLGPLAKSAVPALIDVLTDARNSTELRISTAQAFCSIGPNAKEAIPTLIKALNDKEPGIRGRAAVALGCIGIPDEPVLTALIAALKDKEFPETRGWAADGLGRMGARAKVALPALLEALKTKDVSDAQIARHIRENVANAIGAMGSEGRSAIPDLIAMLQDRNVPSSERRYAAKALGEIGIPDENVIRALNRASEVADEGLRDDARSALRQINSKR